MICCSASPIISPTRSTPFITNTTLGLGDVKADAATRLMAPLTATSGILMIGWSTALFIYVIQTYLPHIARRD